MKLMPIMAVAAAALALVACGKKDEAGAPVTKSGAAAARSQTDSPLDAPYRLKGAEALDIDALLALMPEKARPKYDSASFDDKLGATVIVNLRFVDQDPNDDIEFDGLAIDRTELYGVDMKAVERVRAAVEAGVDAPFEKIFDKVRMFGLKPIDAGDQNTMIIGAAEIDQFRLRRGGFKKADENPAFFFNAFELGGLYFKDLNANSTENDAGGAGAVSFKAPDLRFVGLGGGKLDAIIANDFEIELRQNESSRAALMQAMGGPAGALFSGPLKGFIAPDHQRTTIKSFVWRGIDLSGFMAYGLKEEKPPLTARNLINLGTVRGVEIETYIDGRLAAKVAEQTVDAFEFTWLVPSKIRSASKRAEYDFTAYVGSEEEEAIAVLEKHGLDQVKGDSSLAWDWDARKGDALLALDFKTTNLADFSTDFAMAGLDLEKINALIEAGDQNPIVKLGAFKGFGVKLADKTLLDAIFDMAALEMEGASADDLRQSAPAMIRLSGMQAAAMNSRIGDYIDALANFVAEGGTIEIAARPEKPVPLSTLEAAGQAGPQTLPDVLNLTVAHTPKK